MTQLLPPVTENMWTLDSVTCSTQVVLINNSLNIRVRNGISWSGKVDHKPHLSRNQYRLSTMQGHQVTSTPPQISVGEVT